MSAVAVTTTAATRLSRPPSRLLALTEPPRAVGELVLFYAFRPAMKRLPRGDGHGVLVMPGFLANDTSTGPMRSLLAKLGYEVSGWELGRNVHITNARLAAMSGRLIQLYQRTGRKVSIVGWSLGGVLARELAKLHPEMVRQVISLGSPIRLEHSHSNVRHIFEALNGEVPEPRRFGRFTDIATPPPVPCTSIFTRSDGVVSWRGSMQPERWQAENIEVLASHCGLGVNPTVMIAVADRLAQTEGQWRKFRPHGLHRLLFPRPGAA